MDIDISIYYVWWDIPCHTYMFFCKIKKNIIYNIIGYYTMLHGYYKDMTCLS